LAAWDLVSKYSDFKGKFTYEDNLKQHLLINLHKLLVPLIDIGGLAAVVVVVAGGWGVILVVLAPFDNLLQDGLINLHRVSVLELNFETAVGTHVGDGNSLAGITQILKHVLDEDGPLSGGALYLKSAKWLHDGYQASTYRQ
jgi:hypothetical protein